MGHRRTVECVIRGFAILLCLAALVLVASQILYMLIGWRYPLASVLREPLQTYGEELSWSIPFVLVAIGLWVFQRPLSRLIVPRTEEGGRECAECGYSLRKLNAERCPECGAAVAQRSSQ